MYSKLIFIIYCESLPSYIPRIFSNIMLNKFLKILKGNNIKYYNINNINEIDKIGFLLNTENLIKNNNKIKNFIKNSFLEKLINISVKNFLKIHQNTYLMTIFDKNKFFRPIKNIIFLL